MFASKKNVKDVIKLIAKQNGTSVRKVREEMMLSIEEARNSPDPNARANFEKIFGTKTPTPEEFISKLSKRL